MGANDPATLSPAEPVYSYEHDGDRQHVILPGQLNERLARLGLDVRGINDREKPTLETPRRDEVKDGERRVRGRLVVLVVRDEAATDIGGQCLERSEMLFRE